MAKKTAKKSGKSAKIAAPGAVFDPDLSPIKPPFKVPKPGARSALKDLDCLQLIALVAYFRVAHCSPAKPSRSARAACKKLKKEFAGITISSSCLKELNNLERAMADKLDEKACRTLHPILAGLIMEFAMGYSPSIMLTGYTDPKDPDDDVWPEDDGTWGV